MNRMFRWTTIFCLLAWMSAATVAMAGTASGRVTLLHLPEGAIQPQAAVDSKGSVHLIYFRGSAEAGNLYYARIVPGQTRLSEPIRVNSQPNTAGAIGTVRTAHIAIGKNDRVHV